MASLYDSASLVMIPSGVKEDKLYSIKPTDGSGDFTFSRDADIEATRVNGSGLIEKAKVNLLLQSNTFSTSPWNAILGASLTGGQSGYDGSNDAWRLTKDAAQSSRIYQDITLSPILHTTSIYAKADTLRYLAILEFSGSFIYFDLQDGVVGTQSGNPIDVKIEAVGATGWYRCSIADDSAITQLRIYASDTDGSISGSGSIFIQDSQVNHGLIAQDYVETTTTAVVEGLTADLPRLDYHNPDSPNPNSCPSLLLEPSRTNGVLQSEYFGSGWLLSNATITSNDTTSPEGVVNAAKIVEDSSTANHYIAEDVTTTSGVAYTMSFFAKKGENRYLRASRAGGSVAVGFDLENGDFVEGGGAIGDTQDFGNGWYRCIMTFDTNTTTTQIRIELSNALSATNTTYLGDGTSGVYAYGAQLELGSYPTSYIPTYGEAANRGGEDCRKTGISSLLNDSEGTLFAEFEIIDESTTESYPISIYGTGATIQIYYRSTSQSISFLSSVGSIQYLYHSSVNPLGRHKVALVYQQGKYSAFIDGVLVNTQSSGNVPSEGTLNTLNFGDSGAGHFYGNANQLLVFPTALTDAEAIALTTI